jgi:hypothetical protein
MGLIAMSDHTTERDRLARTVGANETAAPSPPPAPLPYKLPDGPRLRFRDEVRVERDPDKVPYDYFASHPEFKPRRLSRRARWRRIREGF